MGRSSERGVLRVRSQEEHSHGPGQLLQGPETDQGLTHELLHELGLSDDAIGAGLHSIDPSIKPGANGNWTNTKQFSTKLAKDCFTGEDNRN